MRIALFITCFNDTLFPGTGRAVVEVLERLDHEVAFPEGQTCCGQMHANGGCQLRGVPGQDRHPVGARPPARPRRARGEARGPGAGHDDGRRARVRLAPALEAAQRLGRLGRGPLAKLGNQVPGPLAGWTAMRDLPEVPVQSFRDWWRTR